MSVLLVALGVLVGGGLLAPLAGRRAGAVGAGAAVLGGALGLVPALRVLAGARLEPVALAWDVPWGSFTLGLDTLSAFFLLPLFVLAALAAVYATGYLPRDRPQGAHWLFYDLLVACMALVVTARNGVLFLVAWEVMSLASFFLVTTDDEDEKVRRAGWTYLVATHLGTAFLVAMFVLLGRGAGSLDFDRLGAPAAAAGPIFLCALVGFGTKAGFMPMHVWLPEAHPAAPSHVSALMSGVMIKLGIYGLLRAIVLLPAPPTWWGWLLVGVGACAVPGILLALAQRDLKRLLAYSSVENVGVVALGIGTGLLGTSTGQPVLAALGYAAALFHVFNHALFKGLLFLNAGAVLHATGTREIELLGGLLKTMPITGAAFLVGAVAASGLPPLNGFAGEFLLYLASYRGATAGALPSALPSLAAIVALVLVGGLGAAAFAKAFGTVFLGEGRSEHVLRTHDPGPRMTWPMIVLAAACALVGLGAPWLVPWLAPVVSVLMPPAAVGPAWDAVFAASTPLASVTVASAALVGTAAALAILRARLLRGREVREAVTWDCGYAAPTARMQYTASSFARPLVMLFKMVLPVRRKERIPSGLFPSGSSLATETPDLARERLFQPLFERIQQVIAPMRRIQGGRVQMYVLYIALTLVVLLFFRLGAP